MKKQYNAPLLNSSRKIGYAAPLAFVNLASAAAFAAGAAVGAAVGGYGAAKAMKSSYTEIKGKYLKVLEA